MNLILISLTMLSTMHGFDARYVNMGPQPRYEAKPQPPQQYEEPSYGMPTDAPKPQYHQQPQQYTQVPQHNVEPSYGMETEALKPQYHQQEQYIQAPQQYGEPQQGYETKAPKPQYHQQQRQDTEAPQHYEMPTEAPQSNYETQPEQESYKTEPEEQGYGMPQQHQPN